MSDHGLLETVKAAYAVTVSAAGPVVHLCPFKDERDDGQVTITWHTEGQTVELHSLAAYLAGFADLKISHETLARRIEDDLTEFCPGITDPSVTVTFQTAGFTVQARS